MTQPWTGQTIREWAERVAKQVDEGLATASMDLEANVPTAEHPWAEGNRVWTLRLSSTAKGREARKREREALED